MANHNPMKKLNRKQRNLLIAGAVIVFAIFAFFISPARQVLVEEGGVPSKKEMLESPTILGEVRMGSERAPVTIIEYSSFTCPHCANFHNKTLPKLQEYIDRGEVQIWFRPFPLNTLSLAASMLVQCSAAENRLAVTDMLFKRQRQWARAEKPGIILEQLARQVGFSAEEFRSCLSDAALLQSIEKVKKEAADILTVNATPSFFINGQKVGSNITFEEMEKIILKKLGR